MIKTEIRAFIALKINPEQKLLDQFREFKRLFKGARIKWVPEENFHLTLRFIGNTTREQFYALIDRLEELALQINPFEIKIEGAGYFSSKGMPRVLFMKIRYPETLNKLVADVEQAVVETGFHQELKPFRPHLTLGRIKHLDKHIRLTDILDNIPNIEYQRQFVDEFILYQSILRSEGPVYKPIKTFKLK